MKLLPYTYNVIRYVPDPAAGEMLNVGVALYCPEGNYLAVKFEHRYERLSRAFQGFDGPSYKRAIRQFESGVDLLLEKQQPTLFNPTGTRFANVGEAAARIWTDGDLSFQAGPPLAGITEDPREALLEIFERMVALNNISLRDDKRSDDDIWATVYRRPLVNLRVQGKLSAWTLSGTDFEFKFDYTFQNDKRHILEPVSMDYVHGESMQRKATLLLGSAAVMSGHPNLGIRYLLLGSPRNNELLKSYEKAKNILHKMPVAHELIEEDGAEDFARHIRNYMAEHGILDRDSQFGEET
jgi:hypothetical protein